VTPTGTTGRFLRAVARVPGQTAECGCTTRVTRCIAGLTANSPPAARTGESKKRTGRAVGAAAPKDDWPRRTRRSATATEGHHDDGQRSDADADASVVLCRATGPYQASQGPARRNQQRAASAKLAPSFAKVILSSDDRFQYPSYRNGSRRGRGLHEQGDWVKAGVVDMADRPVVEELRGTSASRQ
jgi:hypothetical protein